MKSGVKLKLKDMLIQIYMLFQEEKSLLVLLTQKQNKLLTLLIILIKMDKQFAMSSILPQIALLLLIMHSHYIY